MFDYRVQNYPSSRKTAKEVWQQMTPINSHDLITDYLVILPSIFNIFQIKYLGEFHAYLQNTLQLIILFTLIASQWENVLVCCGKILQNTCEHFKKVKGKSCLYSKKHSLTDDPTVSQHTINASADTALGNNWSQLCTMSDE